MRFDYLGQLRMTSSVQAILAQINRVILGKDQQIRLSLACLLARGHLLIEDVPGVGKTTLAHTLALAPGPLEEALLFDHPSGRSRILMAMRWKAEQRGADESR